VGGDPGGLLADPYETELPELLPVIPCRSNGICATQSVEVGGQLLKPRDALGDTICPSGSSEELQIGGDTPNEDPPR
jgi:hypothetical protein